MLDQESGGACELPADREALQEPRGQDEDGGEQAERTIARHQSHHAGADRHEQDREREGLLAPFAIAVGSEKNRAHGAGKKRHSEAAEGHQNRDGLVGSGEEDLRDHDGKIAVDQDLIELERVAEGRSKDEPRRRLGTMPGALASP